MLTRPLFASTFENNFSVQLDGVNEAINFGDIANFERNQSFSFSFWIKTSLSTAMIIMSRLDGSLTPLGWQVHMQSSGEIGFLIGNTDANRLFVTSTLTVNNNAWHHAVVTYDGSSNASNVKMYIDGVSDTTQIITNALTATILNSHSFYIGRRQDGLYLTGKLDELGLYNDELSSAEAIEIYNSGSPLNTAALSSAENLYLLARFTQTDKNNFPTITDQSNNGRDGTAINMENADIQSDAP